MKSSDTPMTRLESQTRFWLLVLALFALVIWVLQPVLLPFIAGLAIAYFLAPVVNALAQKKIPRWLGAIAVLLGFCLLAALIGALIGPLIVSQANALIDALPGYVDKVHRQYGPAIERWLTRLPPSDVDKLRDAAGQSATTAAGWAGNLLKHIVTSGFAVIDTVMLMIVTPVVAFFTLRDWPALTRTIDSFLPRRHYDVIHSQLTEIDTTLSGFVRGQALVCLALGVIYSVGLTLTGLDYSAAIGVTAGVLSFIPFVGTAFGWITSLILAIVQFGDWWHIGMVIAVFVVGNSLESYVLTPRLVGSRVGLHPVWILFALIAGAKLMGFTGVLIAVPTAAVLGVLIRFLMRRYKSSRFYKDPL